jgi:predicted Zn-dependent protease
MNTNDGAGDREPFPKRLPLRAPQANRRVPENERVDFETWFKRARDFTVQGMFDAVRAEDLSEPSHLLRLGKKQLQLLLTAWAIDSLQLYCEICPDDREGRALLAEALAKDPMTDPSTARKALRGALRMDPKNAKCHAHLACLLAEQGKHAASLESYKRAFALGYDDEQAWFHAANLYLLERQPHEAEALLRRVEPHVEDRAMLVELLAECRRQIDGDRR